MKSVDLRLEKKSCSSLVIFSIVIYLAIIVVPSFLSFVEGLDQSPLLCTPLITTVIVRKFRLSL